MTAETISTFNRKYFLDTLYHNEINTESHS